MKIEIHPQAVLDLMASMIDFPSGQVCIHFVALAVCSMLEKENPHLGSDAMFVELVKSISQNSAGDEKSLALIQALKVRLEQLSAKTVSGTEVKV
jgi:hypothetical protein